MRHVHIELVLLSKRTAAQMVTEIVLRPAHHMKADLLFGDVAAQARSMAGPAASLPSAVRINMSPLKRS
jgi:hypothetical protein